PPKPTPFPYTTLFRSGADDKPVMEEQTVTEQNIVQGPMASQVAIKMLGTNGGGYANANAAHPFENPTPLSNFIQMLSIFSNGCADRKSTRLNSSHVKI